MSKKITIHTDASNIRNSNRCKISAIIVMADNTSTLEDFCSGTIAYAELIAVIRALEHIEKEHHPKDFCFEIFTDHLPNVKLLTSILLEKSNESKESFNRINVILERKGLRRQDICVIPRLQDNNEIRIIWLPRKENKEADKLSKWP
jgi:ribonuclease HI